MKLTIRTPGGLDISFEGDDKEFEQFTSLLGLLPGWDSETAANKPNGGEHENRHGDALDENQTNDQSQDPLNPRVLEERLDRVKAETDIERVTVFAQAAVEAGRKGIDFGTSADLYDELAIPKPKMWKSAFSNARTRGLVRSVARGLYAPTIPGENYAKYGTKPRGSGKTTAAKASEEEE